MHVILIPGLWLDASSWDDVVPALTGAGHKVDALTLPGLESSDADRVGIGLADHIEAVVAAIEATDEPAVLVGHSGGGAIAHGAADARPDRVARIVYVDAAPPGNGGSINTELPIVDGEVPLPDWQFFDDADLVGLTDDLRVAFRARAIPSPAGVAHDPITLTDERRYDVPITVLMSTMPATQLREAMAADHPFVHELNRIRDVEIVDLPTGHWPQFSKPAELGAAIVAAIPAR